MMLTRFVFLKVFVGICNGDFFNLKHFIFMMLLITWVGVLVLAVFLRLSVWAHLQ